MGGTTALGLLILCGLYGHYGYVRAQSASMTVVSFSQETAVSAESAASATITAAAGTHASITYPNNTPIVNNIDTIAVAYDTDWDRINLEVFCAKESATFLVNDITGINNDGTQIVGPIQTLSDSRQVYPVSCYIQMINADNKNEYVNGGTFTMISTGGVASTYAMAATNIAANVPATATASEIVLSTAGTFTGAPAASAQTQVSTGNASDRASTASTVTRSGSNTIATNTATSILSGSSHTSTLHEFPNPSSTSLSTSSGSDSPPTTSPDKSKPTSLSTGTKAGIAFGVVVSLLVLAGIIFVLIRRHRWHRETREAVQRFHGDDGQRFTYKREYMDSMLRIAGRPVTSDGGRVQFTDMRSTEGEGEGEWKHFFNRSSYNGSFSNVGTSVASLRGS